MGSTLGGTPAGFPPGPSSHLQGFPMTTTHFVSMTQLPLRTSASGVAPSSHNYSSLGALPFFIGLLNPTHPSVICPLLVVVHSLSRVQLFVMPWTAACQASPSFTISRSFLKHMSFEFSDAIQPSLLSSVISFSSCPYLILLKLSMLCDSCGDYLLLHPHIQRTISLG